jgi:hypothetical protein
VLVFSLANDTHIQGLSIGANSDTTDVLGRSPYLTQAGSPFFTVVANPLGRGNAIQVSNRRADYHSIDILAAPLGLNLAANEYRITIRGSVTSPPSGTQVILGGSSNPWNWLHNAQPDANGRFTIEGIISNATMGATDGGAAQFNRAFRLQTNNTAVFTIFEIEIRRI